MVDYGEELLLRYRTATSLDITKFVTGRGHCKTLHQWHYQEMEGYLERLETYATHIEICGENRNSYAKTDHDRFVPLMEKYKIFTIFEKENAS